MKKVLLSLTIFALAVTSCDLLDKVDDVVFQTDYTATYPVSVTNDSIKLEQVVNLTSDEEVDKYKDKLQNVTVDSLILKVEGYTSSVSGNKLSGSLKYSETTSTAPILFAEISNFTLSEGAKTKLTPSAAQLANIQNILLTKKAIKVYLRGKTTGAATFTLKAVIYLSVKADALK